MVIRQAIKLYKGLALSSHALTYWLLEHSVTGTTLVSLSVLEVDPLQNMMSTEQQQKQKVNLSIVV